ncbi:hypothetical protein LCGC14_2979870, partial [marine sediment metagenome]
VIGGPPCQFASRFVSIIIAKGNTVAENLIPEFVRCVQEAKPTWWLMENVPKAPEPFADGYQSRSLIYNNRWAPEGPEQNRVRRFTLGTPDGKEIIPEVGIFDNPVKEPAVCASGGTMPGAPTHRKTRLEYRGWNTAAALGISLRLQGLPPDFCDKMPFTITGKHLVVGNGVPLPMGRVIAKAVRKATSP